MISTRQLSPTEKAREYYARAVAEAWQPEPIITVSEWAAAHRKLTSLESPEAGDWQNARTPYLVEIMDCLSVTSEVQEVFVAKAAQVGLTECALNWIGYSIDLDPCPILYVMPNEGAAKRTSRQRLAPMLANNDKVIDKVAENKSRDGANSTLQKDFPGGTLMLTGANSAANLRSMPVQKLILDEEDGYPLDVDGEGHPGDIAIARTQRFGTKKKILHISTPAELDNSRIWPAYLQLDQRHYFMPCPHKECGHMDFFREENFIIPKVNGVPNPEAAHFVCTNCGGVIEEHQKTAMMALENGAKWIPLAPEKVRRTKRSYHLNAFYAPLGTLSWAEIADAKISAQGDPSKLKTYTNLMLGLPYKDQGLQIDVESLQLRAEDYEADPMPDGVYLVTVGVDVQPDRFEMEWLGLGAGEESWSLDYKIIRADTSTDQAWALLDIELARTFRHSSGVTIRPVRSFIDSGYNAQAVYAFVRDRGHLGIFACKGKGGAAINLCSPPTKNNIGKVPLYFVGSNTAKDLIYGRLAIEEPGPGYCHFPKRYSANYYQQLTGEEVKIEIHKGRQIRVYEPKAGQRVEALDCRQYAFAAYVSIGVTVDQIIESLQAEQQPAGRRVRGEIAVA